MDQKTQNVFEIEELSFDPDLVEADVDSPEGGGSTCGGCFYHDW
ncbi:hypothetical protein [Brevibacillus sp. SIMBA_040]